MGPYRRHNRIGVMHGATSGNVMIYYNDKIVLIDFKVFDSRAYHFFVDDELCEISIVRKKKGYQYHFKFDTRTDTALNQSRKKKMRKTNRQGILTLIAVPLVLGLLGLGYMQFRSGFLERKLQDNPAEEWATIRVMTRGVENHYEYAYSFPGDMGKGRSSKIRVSNTQPTTPHGLPLENGDVFRVKYAKGYDYHHHINYDQPHPKTAIKMMNRVSKEYTHRSQGRMQKELLCEVQAAFEVSGMEGLAAIYLLHPQEGQNPEPHRGAYLHLTQNIPFQKAYEECLAQQ